MAMAAHLVTSLLLIETSFLPETRLLLRGVVKEVFRKTDKVGVVIVFCKELVTKYPLFSEVCVMVFGMCVVQRHPPTSSHSHAIALMRT